MNQLFHKLGLNIHHHSKLWIGIITILTIIFAFGLPKIQMKMGNDVFVSQNKPLYKNSKAYQKHFGGSSLYLTLSGAQKDVLSHQTMQDIAKFNDQLNGTNNIKKTTSVLTLLNNEIKNQNVANLSNHSSNNGKLQSDLWNSLPNSTKDQIQNNIQSSLLDSQKKRVQQYSTGLLNNKQKVAMLKEEQAESMQLEKMFDAGKSNSQKSMINAEKKIQFKEQTLQQKLLNNQQKQKIKAYTMTILNRQQKQALANQIMKKMPKVQDMSNQLLHDIFLSNNGKVPNQLSQLLPQNGQSNLIIINTSEKASDMSTDVQLSKDVEKAIQKTHFNKNVTAKLAGNPYIMGQVNSSVINNMAIMLIFAVILMVVILMIVFPVRRRLLPLAFVLVCLVWTFGIMGWLNIPLTLATMATLPIIIGLGTDFGVQFLNRYEEEYKKNDKPLDALEKSISNMGPSVGIALIVMSCSFLTMYLAKAPLMQQFGLTLCIGVICSYIVEMSLIFSTLNLRDQNPKLLATKVSDHRKTSPTWLSMQLKHYAGFIIKHAWITLIVGFILGGIGFSIEHNIQLDTNIQHMIPQNLTSLKNTKQLQKKIGSTTYITYLVKNNDVRDKSALNQLEQIGNQESNKYKDITGVTSLATTLKQNNVNLNDSQANINQALDKLPASLKQTLVSSDNQYTSLQFKVNNNLASRQQLNLMDQISHDITGTHNGMTFSNAGNENMMLQGINNMGANHELIVISGLLIIFILMLLVYRNWRLSLYPVIPIIIVLGLSPLTLHLLHTTYNPVTIGLSSLVLGIGTEFTILIVERYREEKQRGIEIKSAIEDAIQSVGQAITVSGLTVMGGFSAIMFASFPVLKSFGLITVLDTGYSLISALTILPAFIYLLRKRHPKQESKSSSKLND
ncbi:hypothetical protein WR164_03960 [Philodulcilactobacillus myokoensis]|uniref:SSD domain-containing protein n=1 Tax=Philodulcilactobacillus myokoensis TaxID=2929573 RepID=A0A9W6ESE8_9LACO|nr:hydrophobe/amphiphile efflux-3 (HAE3) family transporter [Philodulcilactobacillus myokoensis]GLB46417.1 hypothetical protein WR164_03960 [Philodulcilactobacillus myokoensis]